MAYLPNIPQGGDRPSQSRAQIEENFSQLNQQFGTAGDHIPFDAAADNGKHNKSTYVQQAADPNTAANEAAIYTKTTNTNINPGATVLTQPEVYMREQANGTIYQLTKGNPNQNAGEGVCAGGLQIRGGTGGIPAGSPGVLLVNFTQRFSTACIAVTVSANSANVVVQAGLFTPTGFTAAGFNTGGTTAFSYIAIGV